MSCMNGWEKVIHDLLAGYNTSVCVWLVSDCMPSRERLVGAACIVAEAGVAFLTTADQRLELISYQDVHHIEVNAGNARQMSPNSTRATVVLCPFSVDEPGVWLSPPCSLLPLWFTFSICRCCDHHLGAF